MKAKTYLCVLLLLVSLVLCLSPRTGNAQGALVVLGGVNWQGYCRSIGGTVISLEGPTAYDWHCVDRTGHDVAAVSVLQACRVTYNDRGAVDRLADFYNPYAWGCFTNARQWGAPDLNGYCRSLGDQGVSLDGKTAYDWHCVTGAGVHVSLPVTAACQWTFRDAGVLDRLADFHNPYSWQCWGHP